MYWYKTPLKFLLITLDEKGRVLSVKFDTKKVGVPLPSGKLHDELDGYFVNGIALPENMLAKDSIGTPFQKAVWGIIEKIPYGQTMTYKEIATQMGNEKSSRAVGTACGKNPLALFIPCHRVVRVNDEDFSYSWGKERKEWLLKHEGVL